MQCLCARKRLHPAEATSSWIATSIGLSTHLSIMPPLRQRARLNANSAIATSSAYSAALSSPHAQSSYTAASASRWSCRAPVSTDAARCRTSDAISAARSGSSTLAHSSLASCCWPASTAHIIRSNQLPRSGLPLRAAITPRKRR